MVVNRPCCLFVNRPVKHIRGHYKETGERQAVHSAVFFHRMDIDVLLRRDIHRSALAHWSDVQCYTVHV